MEMPSFSPHISFPLSNTRNAVIHAVNFKKDKPGAHYLVWLWIIHSFVEFDSISFYVSRNSENMVNDIRY